MKAGHYASSRGMCMVSRLQYSPGRHSTTHGVFSLLLSGQTYRDTWCLLSTAYLTDVPRYMVSRLFVHQTDVPRHIVSSLYSHPLRRTTRHGVAPPLETGQRNHDTLCLARTVELQSRRVRFLNLIASPEGLKNVCERFTKVKVISAWVDHQLDEKK